MMEDGMHEIVVSATTYHRMKKAAIGGGRDWTPVMTDTGHYVVSVSDDVYQAIKDDPEGIINKVLNYYEKEENCG